MDQNQKLLQYHILCTFCFWCYATHESVNVPMETLEKQDHQSWGWRHWSQSSLSKCKSIATHESGNAPRETIENERHQSWGWRQWSQSKSLQTQNIKNRKQQKIKQTTDCPPILICAKRFHRLLSCSSPHWISSFQGTLSHQHNLDLITWRHPWNLKQNDRQPHLTDGSTDIAWPRNYPCLSWRHHPWPCRMSPCQWRASLDSLNKGLQSEFSFNDHCQWVKCRLLFSPSISEMPILIVCGRAVMVLMSKIREMSRKKCEPLQGVDFKNHELTLKYFLRIFSSINKSHQRSCFKIASCFSKQ